MGQGSQGQAQGQPQNGWQQTLQKAMQARQGISSGQMGQQSKSPFTNPMQQNETNPMQKFGAMTQNPTAQGQGGKGDPLSQNNPMGQGGQTGIHPMMGLLQKMMGSRMGTQSSTGTGNKGNF